MEDLPQDTLSELKSNFLCNGQKLSHIDRYLNICNLQGSSLLARFHFMYKDCSDSSGLPGRHNSLRNLLHTGLTNAKTKVKVCKMNCRKNGKKM